MIEPLHVGEEVEVLVRERSGWLAVCLAYVVPFVLLVVFVAAFDYLGWSEAKAGTAALVSVAVYFFQSLPETSSPFLAITSL